VRRLAYGLYARRLRRQVRAGHVPAHVAVILDGNRRWAAAAGVSEVSAAYRQGAEKVDELVVWCDGLGIREVTVWALSNENRGRPHDQLDGLYGVLGDRLEALGRRALGASPPMRIRVIGRLDELPLAVREAVVRVERATERSPGLCLTIAIGYSGRDELIDACRALVLALSSAGVPASEIAARVTRESLAARLYTAGAPDPDLIIRTSGEQRLSGFLPWQSAHSELYFTDVYWPAFREIDLLRAIRTYQQRERRYGA
jgi:short-chain Z-isoprenyl diphosphate synthase